MLEPNNSLDPVDWLVWGDYLSDQGDEEGGERAWGIARGLQKTGGVLFLGFPTEVNGGMTLSGCCDGGIGPVAINIRYVWLEKNPRNYGYGTSPIKRPEVFCDRPDLVKDYWDKLAEIGKLQEKESTHDQET